MSKKEFSFPNSNFESGVCGLRDNTTGKYLGHVEKEPEKLGFYPVVDGLLPNRWLVDIEGLWGEKEALDILSEHTRIHRKNLELVQHSETFSVLSFYPVMRTNKMPRQRFCATVKKIYKEPNYWYKGPEELEMVRLFDVFLVYDKCGEVTCGEVSNTRVLFHYGTFGESITRTYTSVSKRKWAEYITEGDIIHFYARYSQRGGEPEEWTLKNITKVEVRRRKVIRMNTM